MLTPELLHLARIIELSARKKAQQSISGQFQSAFQGEGLEFNEVRPYYPGEDTRRIDWNVSARSGSPYIKTFFEDRNIHIIIAVDISSSMKFGSQQKSKADVAMEITSLLLLLGAIHKHKTSLLAFSEEIDLYLPVKPGKAEVLRALTKLVAVTAARKRTLKTDYQKTVHFLQNIVKKRGILFFISDYLQLDRAEALVTLRKKLKLNIFHIRDSLEERLNSQGLGGAYMLSDLENNHYQPLRKGASGLETARLSSVYPSEYLSVYADQFHLKELMKYFNNRQHFHKAI